MERKQYFRGLLSIWFVKNFRGGPGTSINFARRRFYTLFSFNGWYSPLDLEEQRAIETEISKIQFSFDKRIFY